MLKEATLFKDKLFIKFKEIRSNDRYKFYFVNGYEYHPTVDDDTWNSISYCSINKDNEILGYLVFKIKKMGDKNFAYITDLYALQNRNIVKSLLLNTIRYTEERKVDLLICYLQDKFIGDILLSLGFVKNDANSYYDVPISDMSLVGVNFNPAIKDEILYNINNWFVTLGNSDWE